MELKRNCEFAVSKWLRQQSDGKLARRNSLITGRFQRNVRTLDQLWANQGHDLLCLHGMNAVDTVKVRGL